MTPEDQVLPVELLAQFAYCPRRAYLTRAQGNRTTTFSWRKGGAFTAGSLQVRVRRRYSKRSRVVFLAHCARVL